MKNLGTVSSTLSRKFCVAHDFVVIDASIVQDNTLEKPSSSAAFSPIAIAKHPFHLSNVSVEKRCIERYFQNLHTIYYFIDRASFLQRCEREIWMNTSDTHGAPQDTPQDPKFLLLYYAVVALGALVSNELLANLMSLAQLSRSVTCTL
jgi:hypothetical protein